MHGGEARTRPVVVPLEALRAGMVDEAGGKAANLGEMLAAGFEVPDGFCILASAYREALDRAEARGLAEAVDAEEDGGRRLELAARLRERLADVGLAPELEAAVRAAYEGLSRGLSPADGPAGAPVAVAVRSSATAEDLPGASFAGQQETFLNVVGADAVLDAVRRCWASLWTDRAVAYRRATGYPGSEAALAVVVQPLVDAAVAGVLFTADPVAGSRTRMVIDASPGLGESVVSGAVDPDRFVAEAGTGRLLESRAGAKGLAVRPVAGGGTERVAPAGDPSALSLGAGDVAALAALGRRLEAHFGAPQDAEWALGADGRLWLTQTRPITTLHPVPERPAAPEAGGVRAWFCFSLAQGLTRPLTPMGVAALRTVAGSIAAQAGFPPSDAASGPPVVQAAGGRLFIDVTTVLRSRVGRWLAPRFLGVMEARSAGILRRLADDPRFPLDIRTALPLLRRVAPIAARNRVPETLVRALARPRAGLAGVRRFGTALERKLAPGTGGPAARLDRARDLLAREAFPIVPATLPVAAAGFMCARIASVLLRGIARPGELQGVLRGLPNNPTTQMDEELRALAGRIRHEAPEAAAGLAGREGTELAARLGDGTLPAVLAEGLREFLQRYGHRAVAEIDVGMPRWREDPAPVLSMVSAMMLGDPDAGSFSAAARAGEDAARSLAARARDRGRFRGAAVARLLARARALAGLREQPKFFLVRVFDAARTELVSVGRHLADAGVLDDPGDVFFLDFAEASSALEVAAAGRGSRPGTGGSESDDGARLRGLVADRRADYARELRRRHIPRVLLSDGTEPEAASAPEAAAGAPGHDTDAGTLTGVPASAGTVTAPARVVLDPTAASLAPGEVLVAPSTDPGWTPLFVTAGALVMEMGGANSHGAVVAREYGIPAVVGVPGATERIRTGDRVEVDGAAGTVRIVAGDEGSGQG
ncbi:PEP/pyruvate-binding domain-containing protein [Sinomonas mesophila]|uniref:PEP/pyruvate-binding domain-containing protein n=1 Tax=Sinomonas mesophila TaxID=1531955 RepID=UPI001FEB05B8|nr:PEP/pyruvate-binding domain-containing protein [Sinomonas mesophila]